MSEIQFWNNSSGPGSIFHSKKSTIKFINHKFLLSLQISSDIGQIIQEQKNRATQRNQTAKPNLFLVSGENLL